MLDIKVPARGTEELTPAVFSLNKLLDYQEDDTKEGSFEVAIFAELFRAMLDARFGTGICTFLAQLKVLACLCLMVMHQLQRHLSCLQQIHRGKLQITAAPAALWPTYACKHVQLCFILQPEHIDAW